MALCRGLYVSHVTKNATYVNVTIIILIIHLSKENEYTKGDEMVEEIFSERTSDMVVFTWWSREP